MQGNEEDVFVAVEQVIQRKGVEGRTVTGELLFVTWDKSFSVDRRTASCFVWLSTEELFKAVVAEKELKLRSESMRHVMVTVLAAGLGWTPRKAWVEAYLKQPGGGDAGGAVVSGVPGTMGGVPVLRLHSDAF